MSMQICNGVEVIHREMTKDREGLFVAGTPLEFQASNIFETEAKDGFLTLQEAAKSWACWMRSEGFEVFELPRTVRTRDWGLTFSVTARGEESRIFVISQEH